MKNKLMCWYHAVKLHRVSITKCLLSDVVLSYLVVIAGVIIARWMFFNIDAPGNTPAGGMLALVFLLTLLATMGGAIVATGSTKASIKILLAISRFERLLGFLPPTTETGAKALQKTVDDALRAKARNLSLIYADEERIQSFLGHPERAVSAAEVLGTEAHLRKLQREKKNAKKAFYSARDAADSSYLPAPFKVNESFNAYVHQAAPAMGAI